MSSRAIFPLLALPAEIRNAIYRCALNWPDLKAVSANLDFRAAPEHNDSDGDAKSRPLCTIPRPRYGKLSTPSLLLLNRQITAEALEMLYEKPFVITAPPPYVPQLAKPMDITEFIGEATLQNIRVVVLEMDLNLAHGRHLASGAARCWLKLVEMVLDIWCERNGLERIEVRVEYTPLARDRGWTFEEAGHHRCVMGLLSRLRGFGEQVPVVLVGDVPQERMKRRVNSIG